MSLHAGATLTINGAVAYRRYAQNLSNQERLFEIRYALLNKEFSIIPCLFEKLVLSVVHRKIIENEAGGIVSRGGWLNLGREHVLYEEKAEAIESEEAKKCYITIARIINAVNPFLIGCGRNLQQATMDGKVDWVKKLLIYPVSSDAIGAALVLATEKSDFSILNKLIWRATRRELPIDDRYYNRAFEEASKNPDPLYFEQILKFPISFETLMDMQVGVALGFPERPEFLRLLKRAMHEREGKMDPVKSLALIEKIDQEIENPDARAMVATLFGQSIPQGAFAKILLSAVSRGKIKVLIWMKQMLEVHPLSFENFKMVLDGALKKGDRQVIEEVLDFPIPHYVKREYFKVATSLAAIKGHFEILYLYFSHWKMRMADDEELGMHAALLRESAESYLKSQILMSKSDYIGSLKCAAMGNFYDLNPFYGPQYLKSSLLKGGISDRDLESIFDILLEHANSPLIGDFVACMSSEMQEKIKTKLKNGPLKEIVLFHLEAIEPPLKRARNF